MSHQQVRHHIGSQDHPVYAAHVAIDRQTTSVPVATNWDRTEFLAATFVATGEVIVPILDVGATHTATGHTSTQFLWKG